MYRSVQRAVQASDQALAALRHVTPPAQRVLHVQDFGSEPVGYQLGLDMQQRLHEKRLAGTIGDTLLQLQVLAAHLVYILWCKAARWHCSDRQPTCGCRVAAPLHLHDGQAGQGGTPAGRPAAAGPHRGGGVCQPPRRRGALAVPALV